MKSSKPRRFRLPNAPPEAISKIAKLSQSQLAHKSQSSFTFSIMVLNGIDSSISSIESSCSDDDTSTSNVENIKFPIASFVKQRHSSPVEERRDALTLEETIQSPTLDNISNLQNSINLDAISVPRSPIPSDVLPIKTVRPAKWRSDLSTKKVEKVIWHTDNPSSYSNDGDARTSGSSTSWARKIVQTNKLRSNTDESDYSDSDESGTSLRSKEHFSVPINGEELRNNISRVQISFDESDGSNSSTDSIRIEQSATGQHETFANDIIQLTSSLSDIRFGSTLNKPKTLRSCYKFARSQILSHLQSSTPEINMNDNLNNVKRTRVPRLDFFRNQRIIYKNGTIVKIDSGFKLDQELPTSCKWVKTMRKKITTSFLNSIQEE